MMIMLRFKSDLLANSLQLGEWIFGHFACNETKPMLCSLQYIAGCIKKKHLAKY